MEEDQLILSLQNIDLQSSDHETDPPLPTLEKVEEIIGYSFRNKELLKEAFTHASYKADDCQSYEQLKFVGKPVLKLLISVRIMPQYFQYPDMTRDELNRLRDAIVGNEALARAALKIDLHKFLRHRKPLLHGQIQEFMEGILEYPSHSHGMIDPPKELADILKSLIGAILMDTLSSLGINSSMDAIWEVVQRLLQPMTDPGIFLTGGTS